MSLQKMQTSFKNESAESLDDFIARANDLRGQFATASMLDEDAFVLLFLAALSESSLAAWAQSLLAHKPLIYADVIENMRGMCSAEMLTKREAPGQQAYAVVHASSACAYCHKPGHNILQCFKLRNGQRTNYEGISINHQRGGNNVCRACIAAADEGAEAAAAEADARRPTSSVHFCTSHRIRCLLPAPNGHSIQHALTTWSMM